MDDSFDELYVPDNWLELGVGVKRGKEYEENSDASSPKRPKTNDEQLNTNHVDVENNNSYPEAKDLSSHSDKSVSNKKREQAKASPMQHERSPDQRHSQVSEASLNTIDSSDTENEPINEPNMNWDDTLLERGKSDNVSLFKTSNVAASSSERPKTNDEQLNTNLVSVRNNNSCLEANALSSQNVSNRQREQAKASPIQHERSPDQRYSQVSVASINTIDSSDTENESINEPDMIVDDTLLERGKSDNESLFETSNVVERNISVTTEGQSSRHGFKKLPPKLDEGRDEAVDTRADGTREINVPPEDNHPNFDNVIDLTKADDDTGADTAVIAISPKQTTSAAVVQGDIPEKEIYLKKISSVVRDAKIISNIVPKRNFHDIYNKLLDHRDREDRLDFVTSQLIDLPDKASNSVNTVDIFEEVQKVIAAVPSADANEVYAMLESLPPSSERALNVVTQLKASHEVNADGLNLIDQNPTNLRKNTSVDDPILKNDPIFCDMRTIGKMFPEKDRNEIYALLEANHGRENRLQAVIDEILCAEKSPEGETNMLQSLSLPSTSTEVAADKETLSIEEILEEDVERMKVIFPDCDPNYLFEKLDSMKDKPDRRDLLAAEMFDKKDYPKLKDVLQKEEERKKKEKAQKLDLTVEEFLKKFPDPQKTFGDINRTVTEIYKNHVEISLKNDFPMLRSGYIKNTLTKHRGHLYPTYQELSDTVVHTPIAQRKTCNRFMKKSRPGKNDMPNEIDEFFYHELWFVQNELSVLDYPKQKEEERRLKLEEAKLRGELYECCCCYEDECLFEDLASCPEGHLFCKTCVQRSSEAAFGEMKTNFPCLTGECDQNISLNTLQSILPASFFSKIVRRMQEEEVQQANIPDLVTCPFCPFATIMPNPNDKVFKCLNPDCLKESCRLCQEPNHIPLRCNEVEKKAATDMRTYIENKISEAVMRKCDKCGKRFVKDTGCNKMTCVCGATSCYACKAQGIDYDHFQSNQKCADTDPNKIHERDMIEAAFKAKNQYLLDHPEAAEIELNTDMKDMIKDFKTNSKRNKR